MTLDHLYKKVKRKTAFFYSGQQGENHCEPKRKKFSSLKEFCSSREGKRIWRV